MSIDQQKYQQNIIDNLQRSNGCADRHQRKHRSMNKHSFAFTTLLLLSWQCQSIEGYIYLNRKPVVVVVSDRRFNVGGRFLSKEGSLFLSPKPSENDDSNSHDRHPATTSLHLSSSAMDPGRDTWYKQQQEGRRLSSLSSDETQIKEQDQEEFTNEEQQRIIDEYNVPTVRDVLGFALPAIGVWLCTPLLSMIDTSTVGSIAGTTQLAALNPSIAVINYSTKLMSFLFSGTTAMIAAAQAGDRRAEKKARVAGATTTNTNPADTKPRTAKTLLGVLQLSTLVGAGVGVAIFAFARKLLMAIIGGQDMVDPTILSAAMKYVQIRALGMPAAAMLGSAQTACLAQRDARMPLYATIVAAVSNFILDLALIRHPHTWIGGAAGAAWGTTVAQYVAAGWVLRWLFQSNNTSSPQDQRQSAEKKRRKSRFSTRGFLGNRMSFRNFFKLPNRKTSKGFTPFVIPVITTQAGRCSSSATIDHVVSSSLSTASMAANQILTSVYYGLIPVTESLSLAAQSFVPGITDKGDDDDDENNEPMDPQEEVTIQKEKSFAMKRLLKSFLKAAGFTGVALATVIGTLPFYAGAFTQDPIVQTTVKTVVPLIFVAALKHGLFCASEGILLGNKDLKFLGTQYGIYAFLIPYILLQVKKAALNGSSRVSLTTVWQIFLGYDIFRTLLMMGRIAWLERKRSKVPAV